MMMISRVTASEMEFEPKKINLFFEKGDVFEEM